MASDLSSQIDDDDDKILDSTGPGAAGNQTVPSIYFSPNEYFKVIQETAREGMLLTIVSTEKFLSFYFEFHENPFIKYFNSAKHKFILILKISRANIISFKKNEDVQLKAVKPKKSYEIMSNIGSMPGGFIPTAIFKGVFNLAAKAENTTVNKIGVRYLLEFYEGDSPKSIEIVCEKFYINDFNIFLNTHWTNAEPKIPTAIKTNDGCFIATACYGNYSHPTVIIFRRFRDNTLVKSKLGRSFVSFYYKYSPPVAKKIDKSEIVKKTLRIWLLQPIARLISNR